MKPLAVVVYLRRFYFGSSWCVVAFRTKALYTNTDASRVPSGRLKVARGSNSENSPCKSPQREVHRKTTPKAHLQLYLPQHL